MVMKATELLTKKAFGRATPRVGLFHGKTTDLTSAGDYEDCVEYQIVTQSDFLRELDTSGHLINSEIYYPNKIKKIPRKDANGNYVLSSTGNKIYDYHIQKVLRASFPFQEIIKTQQLTHLCGNDLHHELNSNVDDENTNELFDKFKKGWCDKQMDTTFFKFCDSIKSTGDGAIVYYILNGKVGTKVLSFKDGDTLYPHYDSITGDLSCFARKYNDTDEDGNTITSYIEVWDDKYMYRYKKSLTGVKSVINKVLSVFNLDGYGLISMEEHKCNRVPIIYYRDEKGACWSDVQDTIDMYEIGFSHLCQNNMAYAFPILVVKGDDVNIEGDITDGAVKGITGDKDMEASYLKAPESPESFKLQLDIMLKNIFLGSFTVQPPEIKSGDTPGVSVKLIYSPSIEKAMLDIAKLSTCIQDMTNLFKLFYGLEIGAQIRLAELDIITWAIPYIHQNTQELINNLVQQVGAGILSKQTASETTGYGKNNEWHRIIHEQKEAQESDVLTQLKKQQQDAVNAANSAAETAMKQQQNNANATPTANPNNGK